jgi:hypothetical protein
MPLYFFDFRDGEEFVQDEEGIELLDLEDAFCEAAYSLAELTSKESELVGSGVAIVVRDGKGTVMLDTALSWPRRLQWLGREFHRRQESPQPHGQCSEFAEARPECEHREDSEHRYDATSRQHECDRMFVGLNIVVAVAVNDAVAPTWPESMREVSSGRSGDDPIGLHRVRRDHFKEVLIEENFVFSLAPSPFMAAMITSEIPAASNPYSMAVAPVSSAQNFLIKFLMTKRCARLANPA